MVNLQDIVDITIVREYIKKHTKELVATLVAGIAIGAGLYYFRVYRVGLEQEAYVALSQTLEQFNKAYTGAGSWDDAAIAAQAGYRQHARSSLASQFLALQADILLQEGKHDEALETLSKAFSYMPSSSSVYYLYALKLARVKLDSADEPTQAQGLQELIALTTEKNNNYQDQALFVLSDYYWMHDELEKSRDTLKQLVDRQKDFEGSPWLERAQLALQYRS